MELEKLREQIDEIDSELIKLLEKRMSVVAQVADYKEKNNIPILNSDREKEVIEKNLANIKNENQKCYFEALLKSIMETSRDYQQWYIHNYSKE